jgi:hypothetical protein
MDVDLGAYWRSKARGNAFAVRAVVRGEREEAIERAKAAVGAAGGDVLDFKMFSNLSLTLIVELRGSGLLSLLDALVALGWNVEVEPGRETFAGRESELLEGTVQLTFPEGDGELRIPQPAVPG